MTERNAKGLVLVFTGDGKGKTTAALGTVLRALGHGMRVYIVFFMKGNHDYGEYRTLSKLPNVSLSSFGFGKLTDPANIRPEEREQAKLALEAARKAVASGRYDLVVLDEVNVALAFNLIDLGDVIKLLKDRPASVELILTGRYAVSQIIDEADLVTEMVKVKHPFDSGVKARKGIEY